MSVFALDLDEVLVDFHTEAAKTFSVLLKRNITKEMFHCWDFEESLGIDTNVVKEMYRITWQRRMKLYPGARRLVRALRLKGFSPVLLTARSKYEAKIGAIEAASELEVDDLIMMSHKETKAPYLSKLNATHFIDDKVANAVDAVQNSTCSEVYLFNHACNQHCADVFSYTRIFSYSDLLSRL